MKKGEEIGRFVKNLKEQIPAVAKKFSISLGRVSEEFELENGMISPEDIGYLKEVLKKSFDEFLYAFGKQDVVIWDEWERLGFIFVARLREEKKAGWEKYLRYADLLFSECYDFYYRDGIGLR